MPTWICSRFIHTHTQAHLRLENVSLRGTRKWIDAWRPKEVIERNVTVDNVNVSLPTVHLDTAYPIIGVPQVCVCVCVYVCVCHERKHKQVRMNTHTHTRGYPSICIFTYTHAPRTPNRSLTLPLSFPPSLLPSLLNEPAADAQRLARGIGARDRLQPGARPLELHQSRDPGGHGHGPQRERERARER